MTKSYSIAQAKNLLGRVVHEAEEGAQVELTRRGRPVAVLLSLTEFERLRQPRPDFWTACQEFRREFDLDELDIDPDQIFAVPADSSAGKDFSW